MSRPLNRHDDRERLAAISRYEEKGKTMADHQDDDVSGPEALEAFAAIGRSREFWTAMSRRPSRAHDPDGSGLRADGPDDLGRQRARLDAHTFRTTFDAAGNELRDQPGTLAGRDAGMTARARTRRPDERLLADAGRVVKGSYTGFDPRGAAQRLGQRSWGQPERPSVPTSPNDLSHHGGEGGWEALNRSAYQDTLRGGPPVPPGTPDPDSAEAERDRLGGNL